MKALITKFSNEYHLSKREQDVLTLLVNRVVNAEDVSKKLGISQNTVRIHVKNINTKVGVRSKSEILSTFIGFLGRFYNIPEDSLPDPVFTSPASGHMVESNKAQL